MDLLHDAELQVARDEMAAAVRGLSLFAHTTLDAPAPGAVAAHQPDGSWQASALPSGWGRVPGRDPEK